MPQVAYREAITQRADFNYTHKKQTGGSGQYGRVAGFMEPGEEQNYEFVDAVKGGAIPKEFIPSCDKGFKEAVKKGSLIGFPIVNTKITINDGQSHPVDSSDIAFQLAAIGAFREAYEKAKPVILEPIMKVEVEGPTEFQGNIFASINQRRGMISSSSEDGAFCKVEAEVPLSEMFGYSTVIRSLSQGKAEFTMEFLKYGKVPTNVSEQLRKDYLEKRTRRAGQVRAIQTAEREETRSRRPSEGDHGEEKRDGWMRRIDRFKSPSSPFRRSHPSLHLSLPP